MANAKDSPWRSAPQDMRKRKKVQITLSDDARAKLIKMAEKHRLRTQSAVIEDLILGRSGERYGQQGREPDDEDE